MRRHDQPRELGEDGDQRAEKWRAGGDVPTRRGGLRETGAKRVAQTGAGGRAAFIVSTDKITT